MMHVANALMIRQRRTTTGRIERSSKEKAVGEPVDERGEANGEVIRTPACDRRESNTADSACIAASFGSCRIIGSRERGERNSGTYRAMPNELATRTYYKNRDFYDKLLARPAPPTPLCSLILISGCQDNQLSMDGPFNGAFTGALMQTWRDGAFRGSYNALARAIRAKLPPTQSPNYLRLGAANLAFEDGQALSL